MNQDFRLLSLCEARWRSLFETTLTWLEREMGRFLLGADTDPVRHLARLKPLAELTLVCDIGLTVLTGAELGWRLRQGERLRRLLAVVRDDVSQGNRLAVLIRRHPTPAGSQLSALATLAAGLGRWEALSSWPSTEWPAAVEAHPSWLTTLDVVAACCRLGFDAPSKHWTPVGVQVAAHPALSGDAAYILAHVVFFRTDFGRAPGGLSTAETAWLRAWGPVWQQQFATAGDVDLLGEMTMMLRCLRVYDDAVDVATVMQQSQEADGAIPGLHEADIAAEAGADAACGWFRRRYHTTLVANMAAALSMARLEQ